ncbi:MAG: alpha-amylase family glycosyl hydrolase [Promethearchaeota archaeon]
MIEIINDGPRIYNLFPRLVGPIDKWDKHVNRAEEMGFNWIFINPVNFTGFSGSLYAIKDYYKFNPLFAPVESEDPTSWSHFVKFINKCHSKGLKVMYDLVINHTSIDSVLIDTHPEWYVKKWFVTDNESGNLIKMSPEKEKPDLNEFPEPRYHVELKIAHPFAIDPADARKITVWGDLAEIDNESLQHGQEILNYWKELISFYLKMNIDGFRCDAAYQVPMNIWKSLITHAREINKDVLFTAETLGCTIQQTRDVLEAGFDFIYNSSKWWDFTAPWCIEQYNMYREKARSISFPESHDTDRLVNESDGNIDLQVFRYFFAAFFSTGVMLPIGYEFGFKKKLDVVKMKPTDWETPSFDISSYIKYINNFKKNHRCLNEEGPLIHHDYHDKAILILKKISLNKKQQILLIYNKDWHHEHEIYLENIHDYLEFPVPIFELNIYTGKKPLKNKYWQKKMKPNEFRLFLQEIN